MNSTIRWGFPNRKLYLIFHQFSIVSVVHCCVLWNGGVDICGGYGNAVLCLEPKIGSLVIALFME